MLDLLDRLLISNIFTFTSFTDDLQSVFKDLTRKKHVIITGEFNLDLLKLESILSHSCVPKITFPTQLTQKHGTLIDNFIVKITSDFNDYTVESC